MPPSPRRAVTSYGPRREPGVSATRLDYMGGAKSARDHSWTLQANISKCYATSGDSFCGSLVRARCCAVSSCYFFRPAVQFSTTVMGEELVVVDPVTVLIRNRPSGATSYGA